MCGCWPLLQSLLWCINHNFFFNHYKQNIYFFGLHRWIPKLYQNIKKISLLSLFTLCSPSAAVMQWNINDRTHIYSCGVLCSVFLVSLQLFMFRSCCLVIRSAFILRPKLPSGKRGELTQWNYECITAFLVFWEILLPCWSVCQKVHPKSCYNKLCCFHISLHD